jgi:hypothetical protein
MKIPLFARTHEGTYQDKSVKRRKQQQQNLQNPVECEETLKYAAIEFLPGALLAAGPFALWLFSFG